MAEQIAKEMTDVCRSLKHKSLAFAMQRAKEARLAKEAQLANEQLSKEVKQSESQITDLNQKQAAAKE